MIKKYIYMLVLCLAICGINTKSFAAEVEKDIAVKAKTEYEITDVVEGVRVEQDEIEVELNDGTVIRATGEFEDTIRLMVMPITKSMTKEWNWLQSVTKAIGENKSAYDIFFINSAGKRVEGGEGSQISVMTSTKLSDLSVYYIESTGKETKLESVMEEYVVKFKMMKNGYYTLLTKSTAKKNTSSTTNKTTKKTTKKKTTTKKTTTKKTTSKNETDDESDGKSEDEELQTIEPSVEPTEKPDADVTSEPKDTTKKDTKKDTSPTKEPDGTGADDTDKDDDLGDIITRLLIVFVFIATGIIFLIILKKKKKEKDEEEEY